MRLNEIQAAVVACERCPELRAYAAQIARERKRAHRDCVYWGKPVPSFGDPRARVMLVGLAPGAHGSNRTGRPFTGDGSGGFLYPALYRAGFASQPQRDRSQRRAVPSRLLYYRRRPVRAAAEQAEPTRIAELLLLLTRRVRCPRAASRHHRTGRRGLRGNPKVAA